MLSLTVSVLLFRTRYLFESLRVSGAHFNRGDDGYSFARLMTAAVCFSLFNKKATFTANPVTEPDCGHASSVGSCLQYEQSPMCEGASWSLKFRSSVRIFLESTAGLATLHTFIVVYHSKTDLMQILDSARSQTFFTCSKRSFSMGAWLRPIPSFKFDSLFLTTSEAMFPTEFGSKSCRPVRFEQAIGHALLPSGLVVSTWDSPTHSF